MSSFIAALGAAYSLVGIMFFCFVAWLVTKCKEPDPFIKNSVYPMAVKYFGLLTLSIAWLIGYYVFAGDFETISEFINFVTKRPK